MTGAHILRHWKGEGGASRIDVEIRPFVDVSGKTGTLAVRFAINDGVRKEKVNG